MPFDARENRRHSARRRRARNASVVTLVLGGVFLALLVCGGGCEAIVPGTVGSFRCGSSAPSSCPPGQVCATATGQCLDSSKTCAVTGCAVPLTCDPGTQQCIDTTPPPMDAAPPKGDASSDAISPKDVTPAPEAQVDSGCGGAVGCGCAGPTDCAKGLICADSSVLPGLTSAGFFCTRPCCTSSDCPADTVCDGSGAPGSYCVSPHVLQRGALGASAGGATCETGTTCRSGACGGGHCLDTCCSDSNCGGSATCVLTDTSDDAGVGQHEGFFCLSQTTGGPLASSCESGSDCTSNACIDVFLGSACTESCCGMADCVKASSTFTSCETVVTANGVDFANVCGADGSGSAFGKACTDGVARGSTICASTVCNIAAKTCTDYCCVDSDCASYGAGFVCRPAQDTPRYLICMSGP